MRRLRVTVHAEACMASGACRRAAPTVFGETDDGWVSLFDPTPVGHIEEVLLAAQLCPMAAIDIEEYDPAHSEIDR
ncbi:ferredoxin [Nocardia sp. NPDC058176]|uniref:ferredoxin n=1 Tax=Nocardia sp. NPDC058176 TaxID=3346368 RepID=UPI0036DBCE77